uniref:Uncharacterized protein n=1 Tax=Meloidogyne enterolobii TaxID=390850 RepID=A0A6V7WQ08_MELEN|nr:unnamed protein product [Meloidogyne enterolobii]
MLQQQKQQQKHYLHNIFPNKHCLKHFLKQTHLIIKTLFVSQLNNINNNKINKPIISSLLLFSLITDRLFLLFYIIFAFSITNTLSEETSLGAPTLFFHRRNEPTAMGGGGGSSRSGGTGHASAALLLAAAHQTQRHNRCYSCMSAVYEQLFKEGDLGNFFFEPRNFTAQCDEQPMNTHGIGLVPCRGICLSLAQEFVIMGRKTGKRLWMRGCAHSLSRHGYINRTIAFFAEFDMCREVLASELFRLSSNNKIGGRSVEHFHGGVGSSSSVGGGAGGLMDSQPILACSCLGDRCNTQTSGSISIKSIPNKILLATILLFLLINLLKNNIL